MPAPKDPVKKKEWIEKLRKAAIAAKPARWLRGHRQSKETIALRSRSLRAVYSCPKKRRELSRLAKRNGNGKWMKGRSCPGVAKANERRKGKTYKELYGSRARLEAKKRRDSNRRRWDRIDREPQRERHNSDWRYREWRGKVFKRDNWTCQSCHQVGGKLQAHHVKQWALYPKLRYVVSNGKTFCVDCHKKEDSKNRHRVRKRC